MVSKAESFVASNGNVRSTAVLFVQSAATQDSDDSNRCTNVFATCVKERE
jgi:hypothetical protein